MSNIPYDKLNNNEVVKEELVNVVLHEEKFEKKKKEIYIKDLDSCFWFIDSELKITGKGKFIAGENIVFISSKIYFLFFIFLIWSILSGCCLCFSVIIIWIKILLL